MTIELPDDLCVRIQRRASGIVSDNDDRLLGGEVWFDAILFALDEEGYTVVRREWAEKARQNVAVR